MEERGHEPDERLCRDPRNWRRSWAGSRLPLLLPLAALLLAAASAQACGAGGGGSSELPGILELIPADSEGVVVYDLEQMRRDDTHGALVDEIADLSEYGIEDMGVPADELTALAVALVDEGPLLVVEGDLDFAHVADQLEDGGYDYDQYRGFELWEGAGRRYEAVVLFEDQGRMVMGGAEAVKSV